MDVTSAVGRRKTSIARVYVTKGEGDIIVNKKAFEDYFPMLTQRNKITRPFDLTETKGKYDVKVNVVGGGITGQTEAVRLAICRALVVINQEYKPSLKVEGLLTRDPRMVERKKPGQKKARKKFQFSKR